MRFSQFFSWLSRLFSVLLGIGLLSSGVALAQRAASPKGATGALGTTFTYQGRLSDGGNPANGVYDFQFKLYDAATGGTQVGSTVTKTNVSVTDGLFSVQLDFGAVFDGTALWLEVAVRPSGSGSYTTLSPRQALTAAPYALALPGLRTEPNGTSPNVIGGYSSNSVSAGVVGATIGGGGASGAVNAAMADYATIGGGYHNTASGAQATVGGGRSNIASGAGAFVGGGGWNGTTASGNRARAIASTIAGGYGNVISPTADYAAIGGGESNLITATYGTIAGGYNITVTAWYAAVGGGQDNLAAATHSTIGGGYNNVVTGTYATVGGGRSNTASGDGAIVGGGWDNTANGYATTVGGGYHNIASGTNATVGGGWDNTSSGYVATVGGGKGNEASGWYATVGGGVDNTASGYAATVGGGYHNIASGNHSTVPGGFRNTAAGLYSFAAGRRAKADHDGAFVWGDSILANIYSPGNNTFIVRANGGIWFGQATSDITPTIGAGVFISTSTGAYLSTGGVWTNASDRNLKEHFAPVDRQAVLEKVAQLPITTWNYKAQDASIRHMGPMAQDFYAAFGLGEDNTHISTVDAAGVSLVAIQALYEQNQALKEENAALRARLDDLEARVAALEEAQGGEAAQAAPFASIGLGVLLIGGLVWWQEKRSAR